MTERDQPERRATSNMGTIYHIAAGAIYLFVAYMVYSNSPEDWNEGLVHGLSIVAALYGAFRIFRGVKNIIAK